jgi:hypothetical protein
VENSVQNVERWILAPLRTLTLADSAGDRTIFSVGEANRANVPLVQALNQREMQHPGKSRKELFKELGQPALRPLPERPYEYAVWKTAKVNIDYQIVVEGYYHCVPYRICQQIFSRQNTIQPHSRKIYFT